MRRGASGAAWLATLLLAGGCRSLPMPSAPAVAYRPDLSGFRAPGAEAARPAPEQPDAIRPAAEPRGEAAFTTASLVPPVAEPGTVASAVAGEGGSSPARALAPGDEITLYIHTRESVTLQDKVDDLGRITLPIIGAIRVAGLSSAEAEERIEETYIERQIYRRGAVDVSLVANAPPFFVRGAVMRPGPYLLREGMTLTQAIVMAGGPNAFAQERRIRLIRRGVTTEVNLTRVLEGKEPDPYMESGDLVVVPEKLL